jgi:hypothetical protein
LEKSLAPHRQFSKHLPRLRDKFLHKVLPPLGAVARLHGNKEFPEAIEKAVNAPMQFLKYPSQQIIKST